MTKSKINNRIASNNLVVVDLSEQINPQYKIDKSKEYVIWGTEPEFYNNYPAYLQQLLTKSALHHSIIQRKIKMTYGNGFYLANENELSTSQLKKLSNFIGSINDYDSINEILKKTAYDLQLYGSFSWEVIYSKGKDKIAKLNHIDLNDVRSGKLNNGRVEEYFISDDWCKLREFPYEVVDSFNLSSPSKRQLLYQNNYNSGNQYYAIEPYRGAINAINIDYHISNFHINNLRNGLTPTVVMNFLGAEPTEEERNILYKQIKKLYSGTDNAGKFILTFTDDPKNAPTISPIPISDVDKQFLMLNDYVENSIVKGHQITSPMLFGVKTAGQLGGRNEIITQSELFYNDVISQDQQIIEEAFAKILNYNGLGFAKMLIKRSQSVKFLFTDAQLQLITSINERRRMIDLPEISSVEANAVGATTQSTPISSSTDVINSEEATILPIKTQIQK